MFGQGKPGNSIFKFLHEPCSMTLENRSPIRLVLVLSLESLFLVEIILFPDNLTRMTTRIEVLYHRSQGLDSQSNVSLPSKMPQQSDRPAPSITAWSTKVPYNPLHYWPRITPHAKQRLKEDKFDRRELVMRFEELLKNEYPVPEEFIKHPKLKVEKTLREKFNGFIGTKDALLRGEDFSSEAIALKFDCLLLLKKLLFFLVYIYI